MNPPVIEQISSEVLVITWDNDERTFCYTKKLRANCPCAICNEERDDSNPLRVISTVETPELTSWRFVGRYAVAFLWNDGHDTGIYPYEFLKSLCEKA